MTQKAMEIRVLVVDDEEDIVAPLRDILSASGYTVDVAYSGHEAIACVRERRPDCILMDIRMPGINGVDTFREIKRLSPESFVIFMTAYSASSLVQEALDEGAVEVFSKPLDIERVLRLIAEKAATTPVLVADGDTTFCASLGNTLAAQGFDVRLAHTVNDAIRLFEREPRRVVILDMKLEGRSGLDVLVILKDLNPRAIVILMTGLGELRDEMQKGLKMSAYACFWKPFDVEDLIRTIREAVEHRQTPSGEDTAHGALQACAGTV